MSTINYYCYFSIIVQKYIYCEQFLALLLGTTEFLDGGQCGVRVERPQDIAEVVGVDLAGPVEVVDGEGEGCPWSKMK